MNCGLAEDVTHILWEEWDRELNNTERQMEKTCEMQLLCPSHVLIPFGENIVKVQGRVHLDREAEWAVWQSCSFIHFEGFVQDILCISSALNFQSPSPVHCTERAEQQLLWMTLHLLIYDMSVPFLSLSDGAGNNVTFQTARLLSCLEMRQAAGICYTL